MATPSGSVPFSFSQVPGNPSFRTAAVNAVALIPLLSSDNKSGDEATTSSARSYRDLLQALSRHDTAAQNAASQDELLLVVPNSSLTRPGDWRYNDTPLKSFHWQHGCQRLSLFDGRPQRSRPAHDRLINQSVTRDWIDVRPSRRTAAVIGVLNVHDCRDLNDLHRAEEELKKWAANFSTPPYEAMARGEVAARDVPVQRLYVFDSFDEECQKIDLSKSKMGKGAILAFPPTDKAHAMMLNLHLNVVVNDLAVAVFRTLEEKIIASDEVSKSKGEAAAASAAAAAGSSRRLRHIITGSSGAPTASEKEAEQEPPQQSPTSLSLSSMAALVSPGSKLAKGSSPHGGGGGGGGGGGAHAEVSGGSASSGLSSHELTPKTMKARLSGASGSIKASLSPQLLTPMDEHWELSQLAIKDLEALRRRDVGRREKLAADLCLLAGSPLDAYERYLQAAQYCKITPDPLWYAAALEGCASAHIAMAEAGGHNVDQYLEDNFQMPEEIMALATRSPNDEANRATGAAKKQTLPEIVLALSEEALQISVRHPMLAPFHAELLLKMALYTSESAEGHLRCRWGEGPGCYGGDPSGPQRWQTTSVSRLKFAELKTKDNRDMTEINTLNRAKKVCELLSEAVSVGALDPSTRVDVAARAARMCLDGIQASQWNKATTERVKLPRKAAFFAIVAAEALSCMDEDASGPNAEDLWLLTCGLYSPKPNSLEHDGNNYSWATLRATALSALAQGNSPVSLDAAESLLGLLVQISPDLPAGGYGMASKVKKAKPRVETNVRKEAQDPPPKLDRVSSLPPSKKSSSDDLEAASKSTTIGSRLRDSFTTMTATSSLLAVQSKWADEESIRPLAVPLNNTSEMANNVLCLGSVWQAVDYKQCVAAQTDCMGRIVALRRSLHTSSSTSDDTCVLYGSNANALPLYITSAMAINSDPTLELECVKKQVAPKADKGAMATFYNPFANKDKGKVSSTRVAEDEERFMRFGFGNDLAVPLEVRQCRLEFEGNIEGRIKATSLSFVVPPKAKDYTVQIPFTVLASPRREDSEANTFEVKGICLTCLGRTVFLPVGTLEHTAKSASSGDIPAPESVYAYTATTKMSEDTHIPKIEAVPCQPRIQLCNPRSGVPLDVDYTVLLSLTEGEILDTPGIRLDNYSGPSGHGLVHRLQIAVSGLPATSGDKIIFDSSEPTKPEDTEDAFTAELINSENPPPLKIRLAPGTRLSMDSLNDPKGSDVSYSTVSFQIAAGHNLRKKISAETTIVIKFRCCGQSTASNDVWRTREVPMRIAYFQGPHISSIILRPDLSKHSAYADLCAELELRTPVEAAGELENTDAAHLENSNWMTGRIGVDSGINVCGDKVTAIMTVHNETSTDVMLSRKDADVGGFEGHPLKTFMVHKGVTAKIPMMIRRLRRTKEDGTGYDLVQALVEKTTLVWETIRGENDIGDVARGLIGIPEHSLREILHQKPSLIPSICEVPCSVKLQVDSKGVSEKALVVSPGRALDLSVEVNMADWVPAEVKGRCQCSLEFFAVRQENNGATSTSSSHAGAFVWCGKVRQSVDIHAEATPIHRAKLVLLQPGNYVVSACASFCQGNKNSEVWWAPVAAKVFVDPVQLPAQ